MGNIIDNVLNVLANSWFIGIATGLIVVIISRWLTRFLDRTEYKRRVSQANSDITNIIQKYFIDNGFPDEVAMQSIMNSIARQYKINPTSLYSPKVYCEEILRDIISSNYIPTIKKEEYLNSLREIITANSISKSDIDLFMKKLDESMQVTNPEMVKAKGKSNFCCAYGISNELTQSAVDEEINVASIGDSIKKFTPTHSKYLESYRRVSFYMEMSAIVASFMGILVSFIDIKSSILLISFMMTIGLAAIISMYFHK